MGYETYLIVYKANSVEVMNIAPTVRRIWSRIPLRPLLSSKIVNSDHVIERAGDPYTLIEAGYTMNVAQRKWGPEFPH